jgi:hypothetical protein
MFISREDALEYQEGTGPGKVEVISSKPLSDTG